MTTDKTAPPTIRGDWEWRGTSVNLPGGWIPVEQAGADGEHIWSFLGDGETVSCADAAPPMLCDEGTMVSRADGVLRYAVQYRYDPARLHLALDGWQLDDRGERETPIRERFRAEFPGPSEMRLCDLEEVRPGEEESLRLDFRRC